MAKTRSATQVVTGKVRFSYAHVFEPHSMNPTDVPKYSVSVIIPKSDTVTIAKINAAIEAAKEAGKGSKFGGKIPSVLKLPLRDGDLERPDNEEYANSYFIQAYSTTKPGIVDVNLNEIINKEEFYSGCYGKVSLNLYAYNTASKGIAAGLNNLQKTEDGQRLSGGTSAAEDFGSDNEDDIF